MALEIPPLLASVRYLLLTLLSPGVFTCLDEVRGGPLRCINTWKCSGCLSPWLWKHSKCKDDIISSELPWHLTLAHDEEHPTAWNSPQLLGCIKIRFWVCALEPPPKSLEGSGSCGQVSPDTTRKHCRLTQVMAEEEGQALSLVCHYFQSTRMIIHVENKRPGPWSSCAWGNTNVALDGTNPDFCWLLMQRGTWGFWSWWKNDQEETAAGRWGHLQSYLYSLGLWALYLPTARLRTSEPRSLFPERCLCPRFQDSCSLSLAPKACPWDCIGTQMPQKKSYGRLPPNLMDLIWRIKCPFLAFGGAHSNHCIQMRPRSTDIISHSTNAWIFYLIVKIGRSHPEEGPTHSSEFSSPWHSQFPSQGLPLTQLMGAAQRHREAAGLPAHHSGGNDISVHPKLLFKGSSFSS